MVDEVERCAFPGCDKPAAAFLRGTIFQTDPVTGFTQQQRVTLGVCWDLEHRRAVLAQAIRQGMLARQGVRHE